MCTPKCFTGDEVIILYILLIDTDVFCSMILFLFVDDNALVVQGHAIWNYYFSLNKKLYSSY